MFIARTRFDGPDGTEARIIAARDPADSWVDVRRAERLRLERAGASSMAARRIAEAAVPGSMTMAIEAGPVFEAALTAAMESLRAGDAHVESPRFIAPLDPCVYRDFMVFEQHFSFGYRWRKLEVPKVLYEFPVSYLGGIHGFIGPDEEVPWPHYTQHMDYELELGIIIGSRGKDLKPEEAGDYVFGFTILNDFSARDIQAREMTAGLGPSKGKHFASGLGPWIATPDEIPASGLRMAARLNGTSVAETSSAEMIWSVEEIVAWASAGEWLAPGMLFGSGTANGGSGIELGKKLSPGDVIELEIERLGILRNAIGRPAEGWTPSPRIQPATK
jgi:2-keto-4-pentenoate hydratase/2-oxohepta-3-ene-1,7-dioic acid hydratase in catechol pathway